MLKKESERPFRLFVDKVFQDPKSDRKLLLCDLVCGEIKSDMEKIGGFGHNGGHIAKIYGVCGEGYYLYPVETTYTSGDYIGLIVEDERKNEFDHGDIFQPKIDLHDENSMLTWIYIEKDPYKTGYKFELHEKEDAIWIRYYDHLYLMAIGSYSLKEGVNKKVYLDFLKNRGCFPVIYGEAFEVVEDDRTIGYGYIRNQWRV